MPDPRDESARAFLRHTLATLAYRGGKAVSGAPDSFAAFGAGAGSRNAGQILAHLCDVLDWALALADGQHAWRDATPLAWPQEVERFFAALQALDTRLADPRPLGNPSEKLFQGPIADALTHVGQIALLRRLAGVPVRGENYFVAVIAAGHLGRDQEAPRREFD